MDSKLMGRLMAAGVLTVTCDNPLAGKVYSAGASATPAQPASGGIAGKLDYEVSSVREDNEALELVPCRCMSTLCPKCGEQRVGFRARWIEWNVAQWANPHFLTLTVDGKGTTTGRGFASTRAAYAYVHGRRLVAKLMARIAPGLRWIAVLEFQSKGNVCDRHWKLGKKRVRLDDPCKRCSPPTHHPHWHIVVEDRPAVKLAWSLWRDLWGIGGLKAERVKSRGGIAHYLAKYLAKACDSPRWVLLTKQRIRWCSASRSPHVIGLDQWQRVLRGTPTDVPRPRVCVRCDGSGFVCPAHGYVDGVFHVDRVACPECEGRGTPRPRAKSLPMRDRIASCGNKCAVFHVRKLGPVRADNPSLVEREYLGQVTGGLRAQRAVAERRGLLLDRVPRMQVLAWFDPFTTGEGWMPACEVRDGDRRLLVAYPCASRDPASVIAALSSRVARPMRPAACRPPHTAQRGSP